MTGLPVIADRLERLSCALRASRFRCEEPARSAGEGERIAAALRALFRGGPR